MKRIIPVALALIVLLAAGCSKKREITSMQRKQAATLVSEAEFAMTIRDFTRAETLMRQAADLCPDTGGYWLTLGNLCKRSGKTDDARKAYTQSVEAYAEAYRADSTDGKLLMRQMYAQALLGNVDKARALLKKAREKHLKDDEIKMFDEAAFDRMLANPGFKELAI